MTSILVSKTGSALTMPDALAGARASSRGDARNAQGVLRYLADKYESVCYVGRLFGTAPCPVAQTAVGHVTPEDGPAPQEEAAKEIARQIREKAPPPYVFVELPGTDSTMFVVDNPWGVMMQRVACQQTGTVYLAVAKELEVQRRILVVTDPKCYPRHHEMLIWPHFVPRAVLSQENMERTQTCREYHAIDVEAVYAGVENWFQYGLEPHRDTEPRPWKVGVLAHSHLRKERNLPWRHRDAIWSGLLDNLDPATTRVWGADWEQFSGYRPDVFVGQVPLAEVDQRLRETTCGPMIPAGRRWQTTKHVVYAMQGAAPLPWGTDPEHENCYDPLRSVWNSDSLHRVMNRMDLERWADLFDRDPAGRQHYCDAVLRQSRPDFSMLDRAIAGEDIGGYHLRRRR